MKSYKKIFIILGVYIFIGAFLSFLLYYKMSVFKDAISISLVFTTVLLFTVLLIQKLIRNKLKVFRSWQILIINSFLYIIALTFAFLSSFIFYTISITHGGDAINLIGRTVIGGFSYLVSLPFQTKNTGSFFNQELRDIFMTISGLLFLIGLFSMIISYIESHWKEIHQKQLISDSELKALRAQMDPHFLFNSLNTIVSIVQDDPPQAEKLLIKLSDLLHYLFANSSKENIELKDEISFTRNYFSLMTARFSDKLIVKWQKKYHPENIQVPALLFQPLMENAIKHGWRDKSEKFNIIISIVEKNGFLYLSVQDNGCGIPPKRLKKLPQKNHALGNLSERIKMTYQNRGSLSISSKTQQGTIIKIKIPVKI